MSINDISTRAFGITTSNRKSNASDPMEKMMGNIFDANGEMDFGKMMGAMFKMQMMQSMMSNPMMAPYMAKMMGMEAPATEKVDFEKMPMRNKIMDQNKDYTADDGSVADVAPAPEQKLSSTEQDFIAKNGEVKAENMAIVQKDIVTGQDKQVDLKAQGLENILGKNGYNEEELEKATKEANKAAKGNLSNENIKGLTNGAAELKDLSNDQIKMLERNGYKVEAQALDPKSTEPLKYSITITDQIQVDNFKTGELKEQTDENSKKDLLNGIKNGDTKTYVNTAEGYQLAKVDNNGHLKSLDKDKQPAAGTITTPSKEISKQVAVEGLDEKHQKALANITSVDENGVTTIDLNALKDKDVLKAIQEKGINFNGSGKVILKGSETDSTAAKIKLGENATQVELKGGKFDIETQNKALQIKANAQTTIGNITGTTLEQLVIKGDKGAKIDATLKGLDKLEALKIENAKLTNDLDVNSKNDISVDLNNTEIDKAINIVSEQDAQVRSHGSKLGNVTVTSTKTDGNAIFEGDAKTKANDVTLKGKNATVLSDGMEANKIDVSEAGESSGVLLAKGSKIKKVKTNSDLAKDKNEIILEDKEDKNLTGIKITGKNDKEIADDKITKREMKQEDVFKYLGWSEAKYKAIQEKEQRSQAGGYAGAGGGIQEQDGWLARALKGFALGVNTYNQLTGYNNYNPMGGYNMSNYNPMGGLNQMNMQPYNPWMQNGQFNAYH